MSLLNNINFAHYCIFNSTPHQLVKVSDGKYCDGSTSIYKFPKTKLNMTFNEFRQELFYKEENWVSNKGKLFKMYTEDRLGHKEVNKKLHDQFYKFKKLNFTIILKDHLLHTWTYLPKKLDFNITNARHIGYNDSDDKSIIAEDNTHFYYATSSRFLTT